MRILITFCHDLNFFILFLHIQIYLFLIFEVLLPFVEPFVHKSVSKLLSVQGLFYWGHFFVIVIGQFYLLNAYLFTVIYVVKNVLYLLHTFGVFFVHDKSIFNHDSRQFCPVSIHKLHSFSSR